MGAAFTQHPELFGAVVSHVGIYDMLRVELSPNGAFNITEFGTVKDPDAVPRALRLLAVPPRRGRHGLPADPVHDRRQRPARRPDAVAQDDRPPAGRRRPAKPTVLLRTSSSSGHGIGSSLDEKIGEATDVYAFLFDALGVAYRPVEMTPSSRVEGGGGNREGN